MKDNKYNIDNVVEKTDSINLLELYLKNSPELRNSLKQIVNEYPNNMKLGSEIRRLYFETKNNENYL